MNRQDMAILASRNVPEIFIEDPRTPDVVVKPVIAPELESSTVQALKALIGHIKKTGDFDDSLLQALQQSLNSMVREMFPSVLGEINASGCHLLEEYDFVQPARVACLAMLMGRQLESGILDTANIGMSALLMNLGSMMEGEAAEVDWSSGPQDDDDGDEPKLEDPGSGSDKNHKHPTLTADALMKTKRFDPETIEGALHHHEMWDGSGFPSGLSREQISPFARIIAIADAFYELVSVREDRPAYMPHEAVEYILAYTGELFDPKLVNLFTKIVPLYPTGITVKLNTGETGVVADANAGFVGRPVVRICSHGGNSTVRKPYDINLTNPQHQSQLVVEVDPFLESI
ncbi:MAG: HD domain-containing protein [Chloroflexi bacterium]|nr:HD domain-containing protein [Chloroflexota bacterium]